MATGFTTPTLATLIDRISTDINTRLNGSDSRIWGGLLWVLARVWAAAVWGLYLFLAWCAEQMFPESAESDYLRAMAVRYGLTPRAATSAAGNMSIYATAGTTLPASSIVRRKADNVEYKTDAAHVWAASRYEDVAVTAAVAGADGNADAGVLCEVVSPPAGVLADCLVGTGGLTGGFDDETDDDLRLRLADRLAGVFTGGSTADYIAWAQEVPGVKNVWCYPEVNTTGAAEAGSVVVRFTVVDAGAGIIPSPAQVAAVQSYLDARRPATATLTVAAPVAAPCAFTLHVEPNAGVAQAAVEAAVEAELDALFASELNQPGGTIKNSVIHEYIARAAGEAWHTLVSVDGGPGTGDIVRTGNNLAIKGVVTFV